MGIDWGAPAAWKLRDPRFTDLLAYNDTTPVMAMDCESARLVWRRLCERWLGRRQRSILDALALSDDRLLVRYAALNWQHPKMQVDGARAAKVVGTWIIDLADAYRVLSDELWDDVHLFWNPRIFIDLDQRPRLVFSAQPAPPDRLAPELRRKKPKWDERTLVHQVGSLMRGLASFKEDTELDHLILRCTEEKPGKRWRSLADLVAAAETRCEIAAGVVRDPKRRIPYRRFEEGLGWLELGDNKRALECFSSAPSVSTAADMEMLVWGAAKAKERMGRTDGAARAGAPATDTAATTSAAEEGSIIVDDPALAKSRTASGTIIAKDPAKVIVVDDPARERVRATSTLDTVINSRLANRSVVPPAAKTSPADVPSLIERARDALRQGDQGHAAVLARDALTHFPEQREALTILVEVYLRNRKHTEALQTAEKLLRLAEDGEAQYLRGKSLFGLGRLHEAREAFERAFVLAPKMLEAMLLRREVDRAIGATRSAVGEQTAKTIDIPPALAELRDVLLAGDAKRAIAALSEPRFADDPDAQLVLARFHVFDGDNYRAAHVYDEVASRWPEHRFAALLGKANALLDFGYHESALAMFDQLVAEKPTDLDASEGRARALDKLGRTGEAAAEFRRFVSLATSGSDLRVRVAQAWLDAHPL